MVLQDEQLVRMAKDGHAAAIEALYRKYFEAMYRFCYWQTNHSGDAEDLSQNIFIEMVKSIHSFRGNSSFKNWLYILAKRQVSNWIRDKYHYPKTELLEATMVVMGNNDEWLDTENMMVKEQRIQQLLELLSSQEKEVMKLRYLRNFSMKDIAAKLKLSETNVKVICHRSLKKLKEKLGLAKM